MIINGSKVTINSLIHTWLESFRDEENLEESVRIDEISEEDIDELVYDIKDLINCEINETLTENL